MAGLAWGAFLTTQTHDCRLQPPVWGKTGRWFAFVATSTVQSLPRGIEAQCWGSVS